MFALWLGVLLCIRLVVFLHKVVGVHEIILGVAPLLFIYAPVWLCDYRKVDSYQYRLYVPAFKDFAEWGRALKLAGWLNLSIWICFVPLYFLYYTHFFESIWNLPNRHFIGTLPKDLLLTIAFQIFYVAIPEEFFYRGYFQTRLDEIYPKRWSFFGTSLGMGVVYSNLFFAFGHSLVQFQWWHFATFFPGLIFAWARERSDGIVAGALFHGCCNIGIICLDTMFGLRSPM